MSDGADSPDLPDDEIIERALNAENGRRFKLRFRRSYDDPALQRRYETRRQAEVALLANLAFWTGRDTEQMWRIFQQSELYRSELESYPAYRRELLQTATTLADDVFTPAGV